MAGQLTGTAIVSAGMGSGCKGPSFAKPTHREVFEKANGIGKTGYLTMVEAVAVADGITEITKDNEYLRDRYFEYYADHGLLSDHRIRRTDATGTKEAQKNGWLAKTDSGVTSIAGDVQITPKQAPPIPMRIPDGDMGDYVGTVFMHEYVHIGQPNDFGVVALYASESEAIAYGTEYFFVHRFGKTVRAAQIFNGTKPPPWFFDKGMWIFCKWFLMLKWCYEILDGKRTEASKGEALIAIHYLIRTGDPGFFGDSTAKKAKAYAETRLTVDWNWKEGTYPPNTTTKDERLVRIRDVYCI